MPDEIRIVIDKEVLERYKEHYFSMHPKATKPPFSKPYHESINQWMIMRRSAMNALKQKWKDFIKWLVTEQGYANLRIEKCEIDQSIYFPTRARRDIDNTVPKFILDGLVECGMIVDDDFEHITRLTMRCAVDPKRPRTELLVRVIKE